MMKFALHLNQFAVKKAKVLFQTRIRAAGRKKNGGAKIN